MEEPKLPIWQIKLWEFRNNKTATEIAKIIGKVNGQRIIAYWSIRNSISNTRFGDTSVKDEPEAWTRMLISKEIFRILSA